MKALLLMLLLSLAVSCSNTPKEVVKKLDKNSCEISGPQTPRDISNTAGTNPITFERAPSFSKLNLCNIHFHKNAEHKGPEFSVFKGEDKHGGYACNKTPQLTDMQLKPVSGACKGIQPGDTVEVHWVHSSCNINPGPTLGSCLADDCANPVLKVETQVFLLVNDTKAKNFGKYNYKEKINGFHQAEYLPSRNNAVQFLGSTTGPKYNNKTCSPFKVNWSVTPNCELLDINTLHSWCANNIFKEDHAHGVRKLVIDERFLSKIN